MIDINKNYRTRDGLEVRICATDGGDDFPIHGAVKQEDGEWYSETWRKDGSYYEGKHRLDLIEVKEKIVRWVNVYPKDIWYIYETQEEASKLRTETCIACIRVEFEEGEGL